MWLTSTGNRLQALNTSDNQTHKTMKQFIRRFRLPDFSVCEYRIRNGESGKFATLGNTIEETDIGPIGAVFGITLTPNFRAPKSAKMTRFSR